VARFSKDCVQREHRRTKLRYTIAMGTVAGVGKHMRDN
jgi:hypothetical protein